MVFIMPEASLSRVGSSVITTAEGAARRGAGGEGLPRGLRGRAPRLLVWRRASGASPLSRHPCGPSVGGGSADCPLEGRRKKRFCGEAVGGGGGPLSRRQSMQNPEWTKAQQANRWQPAFMCRPPTPRAGCCGMRAQWPDP